MTLKEVEHAFLEATLEEDKSLDNLYEEGKKYPIGQGPPPDVCAILLAAHAALVTKRRHIQKTYCSMRKCLEAVQKKEGSQGRRPAGEVDRTAP